MAGVSGGLIGPYTGGARRLYVGNLHYNITEADLRQVSIICLQSFHRIIIMQKLLELIDCTNLKAGCNVVNLCGIFQPVTIICFCHCFYIFFDKFLIYSWVWDDFSAIKIPFSLLTGFLDLFSLCYGYHALSLRQNNLALIPNFDA